MLNESLLLCTCPVLVEAPLELLRQMLSPNCLQAAQPSRSLDVAHQTNNDHGRGLHNTDSLHDFFLVHLGSWPVQITHDVCHPCLVAQEGSQMRSLAGIIPRELPDPTPDFSSSLAGKKPQVSGK